MSEHGKQNLRRGLAAAPTGGGALLQRDYWVVIRESALRPSGVVRRVRQSFADFAPVKLAKFTRQTEDEPKLGDEMEVRIRGAGTFRVRWVHQDATSFTLATLIGHPEAGRITFGAYRNDYGDVIFHIRSRARFRSKWLGFGFHLGGDAMQTDTWVEFIDRVARSCGRGAVGYLHAETTRMARHREREDPCALTYVARGD